MLRSVVSLEDIDPAPYDAGEVREFYDRYPYPPPIGDLERYRVRWADPLRRRADHHLHWPARAFRDGVSILVAGCGTSQAARHALRWPTARVTGIDVSATSIRCTEELKRKYALDNLVLHELPIERAEELGTSFDQIVCTGVLHHLAKPDTGLSALRAVLAPDGAMQLMVYAPYGRTGIYLLQAFCKRLGIRATDTGIRDLIAALRVLPSTHPLATLLREAPDFRDEAAVADALLHPLDRAYSVPQLFEFLRKGRLTFGRWVRQAPYLPHCGVVAQTPQCARLAELALEEQFAAAELFRGTMLRHSLIAYRDDDRQAHVPLDPLRAAGLSAVPIRMPDTVVVQERLPPDPATSDSCDTASGFLPQQRRRMWSGVNPNSWPELVNLRAQVRRSTQTPTREWPLAYLEEFDALLIVREWPDGSVTAYTRSSSDLQSRANTDPT